VTHNGSGPDRITTARRPPWGRLRFPRRFHVASAVPAQEVPMWRGRFRKRCYGASPLRRSRLVHLGPDRVSRFPSLLEAGRRRVTPKGRQRTERAPLRCSRCRSFLVRSSSLRAFVILRPVGRARDRLGIQKGVTGDRRRSPRDTSTEQGATPSRDLLYPSAGSVGSER
jgi:hypothetical protein